jgi:hypothetical protein
MVATRDHRKLMIGDCLCAGKYAIHFIVAIMVSHHNEHGAFDSTERFDTVPAPV